MTPRYSTVALALAYTLMAGTLLVDHAAQPYTLAAAVLALAGGAIGTACKD